MDSHDVYRFEVDQLAQIEVSLTGIGEDADLYLGVDADGDGVWDNGETIESATGTGDDMISEVLLPGVYFISVPRQSFASNTTYTLEILTTFLDQSTTPEDPGDYNALADALSLGDLNAGSVVTHREAVGSHDSVDVYRFSLRQISKVEIDLTQVRREREPVSGCRQEFRRCLGERDNSILHCIG